MCKKRLGENWVIPAVRLVVCSLFLATVACSDKTDLATVRLQGSTMGTSYSVALIAPAVDTPLQELKGQFESTLASIESLASTYRENSELSLVNRNPSTDWIPVSPELCSMISAAVELGQQTDGAFDITVGPLVSLWGFGPELGQEKPPSPRAIRYVMQRVGLVELDTDCSMPAIRKSSAELAIDLSGWAKGYAVDELAEVLNDFEIENYLVEIGGELRVRGHNAQAQKFAIAIEEPIAGAVNVNVIIHVSNTGMATSGDYRNFFEYEGNRYSHTIDPRTGSPVDHEVTSVSVVDQSTAYADGMATALLVLGLDEGLALANRHNIAAYFVIRTTTGFAHYASDAFAPLIAN